MKQNKPIIGILPSYNYKNEENDPYQDQAKFVKMYTNAITASGGIPIGILKENSSLYTNLCDGYLWPGGSKIFPEFYPIIQDAIENKKPLLGICLGAQAIAVYFNVLEDQKKDLSLTFQETYKAGKEKNPYLKILPEKNIHNHYVTKEQKSINASKHPILISEGTFLKNIYEKNSIDVVSLHSVVIARTSKNLVISATSPDGIIEAIEYHKNGSKILGVQYHPELIEDLAPFEWLVLNCLSSLEKESEPNARNS